MTAPATPSSQDQLRGFLQSAKQRGVSDESLVSLLRHRGFSERSIYRGLAAYYEEVLGESVPSRGLDVENARDAFYYLLNFITLAFWTIALGQIFYMLIERRFPDALDAGSMSSIRDELAGQLAAVIVTFPVFLVVHSLIQRQLRKRPDLYYSPVRRWLTYVALRIGRDRVGRRCRLVRYEFSARAVERAVRSRFARVTGPRRRSVPLLPHDDGAVREPRVTIQRGFTIAAIILVAAGVVMAFFAIGPPNQARLRALDRVRASDLYAIVDALHHHFGRSAGLPIKLPGYFTPSGGPGFQDGRTSVDPVTRVPYSYRRIDAHPYRLCAHFSSPTESIGNNPGALSGAWNHRAGITCFTFDVRRDVVEPMSTEDGFRSGTPPF